ncbi:MAG: four helix bundle protein [Salinivirgaceae bacterium]
MAKHRFKDIQAWQKARELVTLVYRYTGKFPTEEKYALTSQIKRAVVSIAANIAEGSGRNTDVDFAHFLDMAIGSAFELESDLIIAYDLNFIKLEDKEQLFLVLDEVQKLIVGFQKHLRK